MAENKKIEALQVLVDLRSGFTKSQLMEKYDLSYNGLKSLLIQLKGILTEYSVANIKRNALPLGKHEIDAEKQRSATHVQDSINGPNGKIQIVFCGTE